MKDVGPTTYETLDKKVTMPANIRPNIAPAVIYNDALKNRKKQNPLRESTETAPLNILAQRSNVSDEETNKKVAKILTML